MSSFFPTTLKLLCNNYWQVKRIIILLLLLVNLFSYCFYITCFHIILCTFTMHMTNIHVRNSGQTVIGNFFPDYQWTKLLSSQFIAGVGYPSSVAVWSLPQPWTSWQGRFQDTRGRTALAESAWERGNNGQSHNSKYLFSALMSAYSRWRDTWAILVSELEYIYILLYKQ